MVVQLVQQTCLAGSQTYGAHATVEGPHVPAPSHTCSVSWFVVPLQVAVPHEVPGATKWHDVGSMPLHESPHAPPAGAGHLDVFPAGRVTHVPTLPSVLQAWHAPPHGVLQHTPSAQLPLMHCALAVHFPPVVCQLTHWCVDVLQTPALQSALLLHVVVQLPVVLAVAPLQRYGVQALSLVQQPA